MVPSGQAMISPGQAMPSQQMMMQGGVPAVYMQQPGMTYQMPYGPGGATYMGVNVAPTIIVNVPESRGDGDGGGKRDSGKKRKRDSSEEESDDEPLPRDWDALLDLLEVKVHLIADDEGKPKPTLAFIDRIRKAMKRLPEASEADAAEILREVATLIQMGRDRDPKAQMVAQAEKILDLIQAYRDNLRRYKAARQRQRPEERPTVAPDTVIEFADDEDAADLDEQMRLLGQSFAGADIAAWSAKGS
jgi:hypothetical protein